MLPNRFAKLDDLCAPNNYVVCPSEEDILYTIRFRKVCKQYNIDFANADEIEREFVMKKAETN